MGSRIKYIGYFDFQDSQVPRNYVVAASNKMEYIVDALIMEGCDVELISVSASVESQFKFHKGELKNQNPHFNVRFFATFGGKTKIIRILRNLWHSLALFYYLLFHTHREDSVIVYHSLGYYNLILWTKRIKKFKLILEVEEIYQDVSPKPDILCKWEYQMFEAADAFIFSTELLNEKLNKKGKPHVVIYGTYRVEPQIAVPANDGKIHVVYAGIFDPRKGVIAAIGCAAYLPSNYHLHILGFGNDEDTTHVKQLVNKMNQLSDAVITFEGLLRGRRYIEFLQQCHIGLSTQEPTASFNTTSFPSKILSYLANGLCVVSIRIESIVRSAIGKHLLYYTEQTPQDIARVILSVKMPKFQENRSIVAELDKDFRQQIRRLIN